MNSPKTDRPLDPPQVEPTPLPGDHVDFVKRLFAVTFSVGVANQLYHFIDDPNRMNHDLNGVSLLMMHGRELLLLLIATLALIESWRGYLESGARLRPRHDRENLIRFYVDFAIVIAYLILALSPQFYGFWFGVLASIFILYLVWDVIPAFFVKPWKALFEGDKSIASSIGITTSWAIFFVLLALFARTDSTTSFALSAAAAVVGIFSYRADKHYRTGIFRTIASVAACAILIVVARIAT